jgi:hypothetical protein
MTRSQRSHPRAPEYPQFGEITHAPRHADHPVNDADSALGIFQKRNAIPAKGSPMHVRSHPTQTPRQTRHVLAAETSGQGHGFNSRRKATPRALDRRDPMERERMAETTGAAVPANTTPRPPRPTPYPRLSPSSVARTP